MDSPTDSQAGRRRTAGEWRDNPAEDSLIPGSARPVLKWAGGKSQLLPTLARHYPPPDQDGGYSLYIEPFLGGGAVFFDLFNRGLVRRAVLFDINPELVTLYRTLRHCPEEIIRMLEEWEKNYRILDESGRRALYLDTRARHNSGHPPPDRLDPERAARMIFLNRTCFNGLHRVNSRGAFNVPFGAYSNPAICQPDRLRAAARALASARILEGDFSESEAWAEPGAFLYFDPPYRPISRTAGFRGYAKSGFGDTEQQRLAEMFRRLDQRGCRLLLSNSDPTNHGSDPFFDTLYEGFHILRIEASRRINANGSGRGMVRELLVRNFPSPDEPSYEHI